MSDDNVPETEAPVVPVAPVVKKVQEMLNEEKWTRATLSNYSITNFRDLDVIISEALADGVGDDLKKECDEHLSHTRNSIIALYISGVISLAKQLVDDSSMIQLINIFSDNKKWNVVEHLCVRILDYGENKAALRTLSECYKNDQRDVELHDVWERLVKIDYEEADIVKLLAEKKERDGDVENAIEFYKKALHRYINKKLLTNVKEIWNKLIDFCPEDIDFFFHVQKKIAKQISTEKAATLLQDLYRHYAEKKDWNTSIEILKMILDYDDKDTWARREITECFRGKYAGHSHLEEYIRLSNLASGPRSVQEAISDFEKHIAFDAGNFVYHKTWGIGRIQKVSGDDIAIDFSKVRGHHMSLKMAVNALKTLSKDHIWVLKAIWKQDKLHDKVKSDHKWALTTIIKSFDNRADMKRVKAELVPGVLTPGEWTTWSSAARELLRTDPLFGNASDDIDTFIVRERLLSSEEKIYTQFKAEKSFFERVKYMRDFVERGDVDSEYFGEMFSFFSGYLKAASVVNEYTISSYLFIKELAARFSHLKDALTTNFSDLISSIESVEGIFELIKDPELRTQFLFDIKNCIPTWPEMYVKLFPSTLNRTLLKILADSGYESKIKDMAIRIVEGYRDNREAFIWLVKNCDNEPWFKELKLPYEKILITLIHILDISFKEISNHRETTQNRRINRLVQTMLFKDDVLLKYMSASDRDTITRICTLVFDVRDLDPAIKMNLRKAITVKFPDFKFYGEEERVVVSRNLIVTAEKYQEKQTLLKKILEEEVPANSHEIEFARSLGDLRENAEYKAAKEKQDILNSTVAKLKGEIERAQIFDKSNVNTARVSFGTEIVLHNDLTDKEERYTILGPWESDPSSNVISYLSPFGSELINHKEGERLTFVINERPYTYTIKSIGAAAF